MAESAAPAAMATPKSSGFATASIGFGLLRSAIFYAGAAVAATVADAAATLHPSRRHERGLRGDPARERFGRATDDGALVGLVEATGNTRGAAGGTMEAGSQAGNNDAAEYHHDSQYRQQR